MKCVHSRIKDRVVSVVANSVGWELYKDDGRPITYTKSDKTPMIMVSDDEADLCRRVARKVVDHLEEYALGKQVYKMAKEDHDKA